MVDSRTRCDFLQKVRHSTDSSVDSNSLGDLIANDYVLYFPLEILPHPVVTGICCIHSAIYTAMELSTLNKTSLYGGVGRREVLH